MRFFLNPILPVKNKSTCNPSSKKGRVRESIARTFMDHVNNGSIQGLIARCADFYGPSIANNSILTETVFKPLRQGKKAAWLIFPVPCPWHQMC